MKLTLNFLRCTLLLFLMAGISPSVFGQTVTIGAGTSTSLYPFNYYYGYGRDAVILTAAELGTTSSTYVLDKLAWYSTLSSGFSTANTIIRVKLVGATANEAGSSSVTWATKISGATTVYTGNPSWANGWNTIDITDFTLTAGQNLEVLIECNAGGTGISGSSGNSYRYTSATSMHAYWQQDNSAPTGTATATGGVNSNRPNMQAVLVAAAGCSGSPTAGAAGASVSTMQCPAGTTLSLTGATSASGLTYQWESSSDDVTYSAIAGATGSSYAATPTANTYYRAVVTCTASASSATSTSTMVSVTGPAPGNTVAASTTVCNGQTTGLSLQNAVGAAGYQWQSSPDGTTYSNIAGATNSTYTATITANTYYRSVVTCSTGGANSTSTAVLVNVNNNFAACYCTSGLGGSSGNSIENVTIVGTTLNNSSPGTASGNYTAYPATGSTTASLTQGVTYTLNTTFGAASIASVWIDYNHSGTFDASEWTQLTTSGTSASITITPSYASLTGTTGMRIRTRATGNNNGSGDACSNFGTGEAEDYIITIAPAPACAGFPTAPGNTTSSMAIATSGTPFTLGFQNTQTTSGMVYTWYVSTDGTNYSVVAGATSSTYTVTQTGTGTYYYYADVTCSNSNKTVTSNPVTVPTQIVYCVPSVTYGCGDFDVIARVQLNTLDNNSGTTCPSDPTPDPTGNVTLVANGEGPGYSDYYNSAGLTTTLKPATTYNMTVSVGQFPESFAAWIDYNDDGVFNNANERVGFTSSVVAGSGTAGTLGSSASFPITLSCTPPSGAHRMRVRCQYGTTGSAITPCGAADYGETEDYKITISAQANCAPGGLLSASNPGSTTVDLAWTPGCSTAPKWDFEYGPAGFVQGGGSGTVIANQTASGTYTLTGLASATNYDVYYRARCGAGSGPGTGNSTWSLVPASFTTLAAPCAGTPDADTVHGPSMTCSGVSFTLTATGPTPGLNQTYQWEVSTNGGTSWTAISGATDAMSISTSQTVASSYRKVTTCTNSSLSNASAPYAVAMENIVNCFCSSSPIDDADGELFNVTIGSLNNSSDCSSSDGLYTDYKSVAAPSLRQGAAVGASFLAGSCGGSYGGHIKVYADWNHDGVIDEATETAFTSSSFVYSPAGTPVSGFVNVPATASLGATFMRVVMQESTSASELSSCGSYDYGETEDYIVNVIAACTKVPKTPGAIVADTTLKVCGGEKRTYTIAWGADADSYVWTAPTGGTITAGQGTNKVRIAFDAGFTANDTLFVSAVNACGSSLLAKSVIISFRGAPATPGTITPDTTLKICPGEFRIYDIAANPLATSYTWTAPTGGSVTTGQGTTHVKITYAAGFVATGNVTVTATNGCGTSAAKASIAYFRGAPKSPGKPVMNPIDKVCPGESRTFTLPLPVDFATSYVWATPVGAVTSGQGTMAATLSFNSTMVTDTPITVASVNTCGTSAPKIVKVGRRGVPKTPLGITGNLGGVCGASGEPYSITGGTAAGTNSYNWSFNTVNASVATGQGTNTIGANFAPAYTTGILSVSATNGCGTSLLSKSITITAIPAKAVVSGSTSVCSNTAASYTAAVHGATSYTWNSPTGSTITDANGTGPSPRTSSSATVTVNFGTTVGSVGVIATNSCGSSAKSTYVVTNCNLARGVEEVVADALEVELTPNPATEQVKVSLNASEDSRATVRILSMTGQQMISMDMSSTQHSQLIIPINQLAAGMYMVEVTTANGEKQVKQLVKQ